MYNTYNNVPFLSLAFSLTCQLVHKEELLDLAGLPQVLHWRKHFLLHDPEVEQLRVG